MNRLSHIITDLKTTFTQNRILPVPSEWIATFEAQHGPIPPQLKELYQQLGYGSFGEGHFQIQCLLEPEEVYPESTAKDLAGIFIVITVSDGSVYAYDTGKDWAFGEIDLHGKFIPLFEIYPDLYDYLESTIQAELEL